MRTISIIGALLCLMLAAEVATAQDEEATTFTYVTYFHCDADKEEAADAMMERDARIIDKLVDDGVISAWGWIGHHTGGQWRRARYHQSDSLEGAMTAVGKIGDALTKAHGEDDAMGRAFAQACPRHDDYVWQVDAGTGVTNRGTVGFSVYYVCDVAREERADALVDSHFAPILDGLVEDGKLASWGWQSHVIGGRARKLQTMTAADLPTLLAARTESIEKIYADENAAGLEFTEICGPHVDYVWNLIHEKN